jgi:hypothetical protein
MDISRLVGLWMYVLWYRYVALVWPPSRSLPILKKLQASLDVYVRWVEVGRTLVCIERVSCLIVAGLVLCHR